MLLMELMSRRELDICCLQETRLPGEGTEVYHDRYGKYKLFCLVMNFFSVYAPQVGRPAEKKVKFYDDLVDMIAEINPDERIIIAGDMNAM